ncbi:MAG: hypothetical protein M0024_01460 [Nitrospiraceae bacterium]|nr:hypothetical protein [Nitrospiraceae bacterium]
MKQYIISAVWENEDRRELVIGIAQGVALALCCWPAALLMFACWEIIGGR